MFRPDSAPKAPQLQLWSPATPALKEWLAEPGFTAAWQARRILKRDARRQVAVLGRPDGSQVLLKCIWPGKLRDFAWRRFGAADLLRTHRGQNILREQQVQVPQSLAVMRWQPGGDAPLWGQLQEFVDGAVTLHAVLSERNMRDHARWWRLVEQTVSHLARIHELGRYHGDMKLTNILVRATDVYLVDVSGWSSPRIRRWQQKDLARFLIGLLEVNVDREQLQTVCDLYRARATSADDAFMQGVSRFAIRIGQRHAQRYGLPFDAFKLQSRERR